MPDIRPISAITFGTQDNGDLSSRIAPPYDVLDETSKAQLLAADPYNIVAIDLPHLPAKTVGPDEVYQQAGEAFGQWLDQGILTRRQQPALFAYQQTYTVGDRTFKRRGLIANVRIQPFGPAPAGSGGGIYPHEQTFSGPKEDRLKLMRATQAQLSPIFGLHSDPQDQVGQLLARRIDGNPPDFLGTTANDDVVHEVWAIDQADPVAELARTLADSDVFIADGHHRYTTALNYRNELIQQQGPLPDDHPANYCLFVLVAMQDPGMIVLPTHRLLGGMAAFDFGRFVEVARGRLDIKPFAGRDLEALQAALPAAGPHAVGLYHPGGPGKADQPMWIATTVEADPLAEQFPDQSADWRQLDVAIVQHLIVEQLCEPHFCQGGKVAWKFPHSLADLRQLAAQDARSLGVVMQATPLESVRKISEHNELMPQKSTFFYPKLATGLVVNPLM